jgi:C_GCAxxG_C_C family probable redox protein
MNINIDERVERARNYFLEGYNCAQAVVMAFDDVMAMDVVALARLAAPFGGGMGRMREVCGTVSGMFMVAGMTQYTAENADKSAKDNQYAFVQNLANKFKDECGSIICRELLALPPKTSEPPVSEERTEKYYSKRPCAECVRIAASILEAELKNSAVNTD